VLCDYDFKFHTLKLSKHVDGWIVRKDPYRSFSALQRTRMKHAADYKGLAATFFMCQAPRAMPTWQTTVPRMHIAGRSDCVTLTMLRRFAGAFNIIVHTWTSRLESFPAMKLLVYVTA
jgi:hypothetical protein